MTVFRRNDLGEWLTGNVGLLRAALIEIPDHWEIVPNGVGNLALCEPDPEYKDHGTRWYVGYIDMATGDVFVKPGIRNDPNGKPGYAKQCPWEIDPILVTVDRSDFETNDPYRIDGDSA